MIGDGFADCGISYFRTKFSRNYIKQFNQYKKFDKTHISDTSDIRIPIYDVYMALVDNSVIQLSDLYCADATELERQIA